MHIGSLLVMAPLTHPILIALDLLAVIILVFGIYFPRHRRRDMVVAIFGINIGVMAVATALDSAEVSAGLGLGLFGVLSIIRIRSLELPQEDITYYFTAIAMGLLGGISVTPGWVTLALMAAILLVLFGADHPRLLSKARSQTITLDRAYPDEQAARDRLQSLLGADITRMRIKKLDLVNDSTVVDVSYSYSAPLPHQRTSVSHHPELAELEKPRNERD